MMTSRNVTLQVNRSSHGETRVIEAEMPPLAPGQVRFRVDRFALTANTVTYATTGDTLGYWDFFPTGEPGWGCVPAMGWAEVVESRHPDVSAGGRYYGWYPMARYVDMTVTPNTDGLRDEGPHRAAHAPVYRAYTATTRDTLYQAGTDAEDRHALLRGLFLTGWLAEDFFADNDWFGARRVLVLSASSKTAIGFAHCADARAGIEVIGVTSSRNHAFTHALGCYDEVVTYEDVTAIPRSTPIVSIDMAGSGLVLASVHAHFADQLRHSMAIGRSHHEAPSRVSGMPGPKPVFFFAPTQVKKRVQDWGPRGYQERVVKALSGFVAWSSEWLIVQQSRGAPAAKAAWGEVHAGRVAANIGHVVSLWD
jgi:NADPH:quinone reductase-like Zn-dependent oxidoreductase